MSSVPKADADGTAVPVPPRYWWLKRIVVAVLVIAVLVAIVRWRWGVVAWRAYDAEIARIKAAGEPIFPEDFVLPPVPEERNAAPLLVKATQALNLSQEQTRLLKTAVSSKADLPRNLRELNQLMAVTSPARALVREAGMRPEVDWGSPGPRLSAPVVRLQPYRDVGECLVVAAHVGHLQGDDLEAIRSLEDTLNLASHLAEYRSLHPVFLHLGLTDAVVGVLESISPDLRIADSKIRASSSIGRPTHDQCRQLASRLLDDEIGRGPFLWALYAERAFHLDAARALIDEGRTALSARGTRSWMDRCDAFMLRPMFVLDTTAVLRENTRMIDDARELYLSRVPAKPADPHWRGIELASHYLRVLLTPSLGDMHRSCFLVLARARLAAVVLAVRMYEVEHGERPLTLDALVPDYLACVPTSPLLESDDKMHYEREGDSPKVYFNGLSQEPVSRTVLYLNGRSSVWATASRPASSTSQTVIDQPQQSAHQLGR